MTNILQLVNAGVTSFNKHVTSKVGFDLVTFLYDVILYAVDIVTDAYYTFFTVRGQYKKYVADDFQRQFNITHPKGKPKYENFIADCFIQNKTRLEFNLTHPNGNIEYEKVTADYFSPTGEDVYFNLHLVSKSGELLTKKRIFINHQK